MNSNEKKTMSLAVPSHGLIEHLRMTDANNHSSARWTVANWIVEQLREQGEISSMRTIGRRWPTIACLRLSPRSTQNLGFYQMNCMNCAIVARRKCSSLSKSQIQRRRTLSVRHSKSTNEQTSSRTHTKETDNEKTCNYYLSCEREGHWNGPSP